MTKLKLHLPSLLSVAASFGVISTSVLAVKATPKALNDISESEAITNKEIIKAAWKEYIPTVASGVGTIFCILMANGMNKKQQDSLIAAYAALHRSYDSYKRQIIERHGIEEHAEIMDDISIEDSHDPQIWVPGIYDSIETDFHVDEEEHLFYDTIGNRYFNSTIGRVLQAEYHLNRNFCLGAAVSVNDFYEFLGIEKTEDGNQKGWVINDDDMLYWIDFSNYTAKIDDLECMIIEPVWGPSEKFLEYV